MIETLCDFNNGVLVDDVFDLIEKIVAKKHGVLQFDLLIEDPDDNEVLIYKEEFQDEINFLYDKIEEVILHHLND